MITFYPPLNEIRKNKNKYCDGNGELEFLEFLERIYRYTDYEVYFQSRLDAYRSDVIILDRNNGIFIIEVKCLNLALYQYDYGSDSFFKGGFVSDTQPFKQINNYRDKLFEICEPLKVRKIIDDDFFKVVSMGVYFHGSSPEQLNSLLPFNEYGTVGKTYSFAWADIQCSWEEIKRRIDRRFSYGYSRGMFTRDIYEYMHLMLAPSFEKMEQYIPYKLSTQQQNLSVSSPRIQQKVKGCAGSGKTLVLVHRAVNAHQRTGGNVLILTFNRTLKNYIYAKFSQVIRKIQIEQEKNNYVIMHFHGFIFDIANDMGFEPSSYDIEQRTRETIKFLNENKSRVPSEYYHSVFIDEVQDFESEWISLIRNVFLDQNDGEMVLFADEKQDVYGKTNSSSEANHMPNTGIAGRWNVLSESYRQLPMIAGIVSDFTEKFYDESYENRRIFSGQSNMLDDSRFIYQAFSSQFNPHDFCRYCMSMVQNYNISINDIAVIVPKHEYIISIADVFREFNIVTATVSETSEERQQIMKKCGIDQNTPLDDKKYRLYNRMVNDIRAVRKENFHMNYSRSCMKISTIESFKGWEIKTIILLLDCNSVNDENTRHIYTSVSRTRQNLFIADYSGNTEYSRFFAKEYEEKNGL